MLRAVCCYLILFLLHPSQDVRVVTYSAGKINTSNYEGLSFWIKDNQKAYIRYAQGKDTEDIDLTWAGPVTLKEGKGFKVQFPAPDTSFLYIIPQGLVIKVVDRGGRLRPLYSWENEGHSGDATAGCSICARDEKEAMQLLQKYFFR